MTPRELLVSEERLEFEEEVRRRFKGDALACIAQHLRIWSKVTPQLGSLSARYEIYAEVIEKANSSQRAPWMPQDRRIEKPTE